MVEALKQASLYRSVKYSTVTLTWHSSFDHKLLKCQTDEKGYDDIWVVLSTQPLYNN